MHMQKRYVIYLHRAGENIFNLIETRKSGCQILYVNVHFDCTAISYNFVSLMLSFSIF